MNDPVRMVRNAAAMLLIVVACPSALFGGAVLGCAASSLDVNCALSGVFIEPFLLAAAGFLAALLTRGWWGVFLMFAGVIVGMAALATIAGVIGRPVPIDPVQGFIAAVWFGFPVAVGYGIGRGVMRLLATRPN